MHALVLRPLTEMPVSLVLLLVLIMVWAYFSIKRPRTTGIWLRISPRVVRLRARMTFSGMDIDLLPSHANPFFGRP